ncbi:MAG TPA: TIGR00730 family Rossman fold protein [Tenuifilaceae bacterium]|nr:TIGR00730 family Rossman fold protein [Tenuifilaceae bacterium]HQB78263.1 TIGR00730 family Rossman fold protein [Tenuifilaceae bacterium]
MRICVFCASSAKVDKAYFDATKRLAEILAKQNHTIVYGGGSAGLMGCLADTALLHGGDVEGILPRFMDKVEWGHKEINRMILVDDMRERKKLLTENVDAVVTLPGGCGTLEELMEVFTLKRLGKFTKPIIVLNTKDYYKHLNLLVEQMISEHFLRQEHRQIWQLVNEPEDILPAITNAPKWDSSAINFAAV